LIGGGVVFGASYGYALLFAVLGTGITVGSTGGENQLSLLVLPVAGPFVTIGRVDGSTERALLVALGAAETLGAVMLYIGLTRKKRVLVRNDLVGNMTLVPMAGDGATGMLLSGSF
jgi:hypothetical protein